MKLANFVIKGSYYFYWKELVLEKQLKNDVSVWTFNMTQMLRGLYSDTTIFRQMEVIRRDLGAEKSVKIFTLRTYTFFSDTLFCRNFVTRTLVYPDTSLLRHYKLFHHILLS